MIRQMFSIRALLSLCFAIFIGVLLFNVSQDVQKAEDDKADLRDAIHREAQSIRVLEAEWSYLNSPERLDRLAEDFLGLGVVEPSAGVADLPGRTDDVIQSIDVPPKAIDIAVEPDSPQPFVTPPKMPARPQKRVQRNFSDVLNSLDESRGEP